MTCHGGGTFAVWTNKRDPAFGCSRHVGEIVGFLLTSRTRVIKVAWAGVEDAPCNYGEMSSGGYTVAAEVKTRRAQKRRKRA